MVYQFVSCRSIILCICGWWPFFAGRNACFLVGVKVSVLFSLLASIQCQHPSHNSALQSQNVLPLYFCKETSSKATLTQSIVKDNRNEYQSWWASCRKNKKVGWCFATCTCQFDYRWLRLHCCQLDLDTCWDWDIRDPGRSLNFGSHWGQWPEWWRGWRLVYIWLAMGAVTSVWVWK